MKITNFTSTVAPAGGSGRTAPSKPEGNGAPARASASAPELRSQGVVEALAASGEVDLDKVNQIRQAISEGRLSLDPEKLAEALLALHRR